MTVKNGVFPEQPGRSRVGNGRGGGSAAARGAGSERHARRGLGGCQSIILLGKPRLLFPFATVPLAC